MKVTRLLILALMVVGASVFTSCKDYDEDNYNALYSEQASIKAALQTQINQLSQELNALKASIPDECKCAGKGYLTLSDLAGYVQSSDLANYATKGDIKNFITDVELANEATRLESLIDAAKDALNGTIADQAKAIQLLDGQVSALNNLIVQKADKKDLEAIDDRLNLLENTTLPAISDKADSALRVAQSDYLFIKALEKKVSADSATIMNALAEKAESLAKDIEKAKEAAEKYADEAIVKALEPYATTEYVDVEIGKVKEDVDKKANKEDLKALETRVETLEGQVAINTSAIETLTTNLENLEKKVNALAQRVNGITIQSVYCPAVGELSLPTNFNTNILLSYFGLNTNPELFTVGFPKDDPQETYKVGEILVQEQDGNAGTIYLTVNPTDYDFEGLNVKLINSQNEECKIALSPLAKTDKTIQFGYSRAAGDVLYEAKATLKPQTIKAAMEDPKLNVLMNVDTAAVKSAIVNLIHSNGKTFKGNIKEVASTIVSTVEDLKLDAQGVKSTYKDEYGEKNVVSNFGIAAIATQPLGFYTLDVDRKHFFGYNKVKSLITKIANKLTSKVATVIKKNLGLDGYASKLKDRAIIKIEAKDSYFEVTVSYAGNSDVYSVMEQLAAYTGESGDIYDVNTAAKTFKVAYDIDELEDFVEGLTINDLANMTKMANDLLNQVNNVLAKIQGKGYMNKIYAYLDEIDADLVSALNRADRLFQPVLFVNSDKGFSRAGLAEGASAKVSGEVTIYPTTYSLEYLAPVFKKYIKINDNAGELVTGTKIDVTSKLKSGVNTIVYSALDYYGNEITETYYLTK